MATDDQARIKLPGFGLPLEDLPEWDSDPSVPRERFPHAIVDNVSTDGVTLREQHMLDFINQITDKPRWTEKINDDAIVAKWRAEACGTFEDWDTNPSKLSPECFDYCLAELRDKAQYMQQHGVIHVLDCSATVVKKDLDQDDALCRTLAEAVAPLEDVPAHRRDWHPGSNGLVLDLLHPSLHPLIYGRSRVLPTGKVDLATCSTFTGKGEIIPVPDVVENNSELSRAKSWAGESNLKPWGSYQWLPSDITLGADGKASIDSYINNLHPQQHGQLYAVLQDAVEKAVPLWEDCLSWWHNRMRIDLESCGYEDYVRPHRFTKEGWVTEEQRELIEQRREEAMQVDEDEGGDNNNAADEVNDLKPEEGSPATAAAAAAAVEAKDERSGDDEDETKDDTLNEDEALDENEAGDDPADEEASDDEDQEEEWAREEAFSDWLNDDSAHRQIHQPDPQKPYIPHAERIANDSLHRLDLRTDFPSGLQVIFKLANIHLTPSSPRYDGSNWHVEGALNEHICATALLYYDSENVTDSHLAFRCAVDAEAMVMRPQQNEFMACEDLYGIRNEDAAVQEIGKVLTRPDRMLAFPNVMQHRVRPFELLDKTRSGHRKILAMFLVDPHIRVLSTANVPPQRVDWWGKEVRKVRAFARLPLEVFEKILVEVEGFPLSWREALEVREALMEERGRMKESLDQALNEDTFFFCEH